MSPPTERVRLPLTSAPLHEDHEDPTAALRQRARDWGLARLDAAPWAELRGRATLLLVDPPAVRWATAARYATLWLLLENSEARALPPGRRGLVRAGSEHERVPAAGDAPEVVFSVFTLERMQGLLQGAGRRSLETRWRIRHAEPLHDPLRRQEQLSSAALQLPDDALERIARPLFLQLHATIEGLRAAAAERPAEAVILAGEAAGALCRLACALDSGMHPPPAWLLPAAAGTELGARLTSWLDDLPRMLAGDEAAGRRVAEGCDAVERAAAAALRPHFDGADWLRTPEAYALRAPR